MKLLILKKSYMLLVPAILLALVISCKPIEKYIHAQENHRWEADIHAFDSLNALEPINENAILVTGSSSVKLWDSIHYDLAPYEVVQRGYGGSKLSDYNLFAERIIKPLSFKAILIFIANDIPGGEDDRTPREVYKLFENLVQKIRSRNPGTPICWIETTPTPSRWHVNKQVRKANGLIRELCESAEDLHFIDTYHAYLTPAHLPDSTYFRDDMLHLNRLGYLQWSGIIKASLKESGIEP